MASPITQVQPILIMDENSPGIKQVMKKVAAETIEKTIAQNKEILCKAGEACVDTKVQTLTSPSKMAIGQVCPKACAPVLNQMVETTVGVVGKKAVHHVVDNCAPVAKKVADQAIETSVNSASTCGATTSTYLYGSYTYICDKFK
mgnify:CR=1 FL=1